MRRMKPSFLTASLLAIALGTPTFAQEAGPATPDSVVAAAPARDWKPIDPGDLLVMDLAPDAHGKKRQVIIQLIPPPFSQGWVDNIRTLARAHWWDGTSVYRVVDNWVAQWGDVDDAKPLPEGIEEVPESEYQVANPEIDGELPLGALSPDSYAYNNTYFRGFPIAGTAAGQVDWWWPVHCYGTVGVARSLKATGTGSELYAVIGHAPRQLDSNIAVVGRVIEGVENLSTLPRGKGDAGVYDDPELRVPIVSVRLGDELPAAEQPHFEYLSSDSQSFADYVHVRANRNDAFYKVPAGGIDVCNVQVPIWRAER